MLGLDVGAFCASVILFLALPGPGTFMLLSRGAGAALPVRVTPGRYLRQGFLITLSNPKAIVFYMAFFPLFIDPVRQQGAWTFAFMALLIALITAAWCLTLCAGAEAVAGYVRTHCRLARALQRLAGLALLGFGWRLMR
jgi:threonine/homoserine/homoserine lactone efflux protein